MEIPAIIPVEGGVFSFGVCGTRIDVETEVLSVSLISVVSVISVEVSVELSEIGKFVSVSVNSSVSVTVSDSVPVSVSVLVDVSFDEVLVDVFVEVLEDVVSVVVSVLVDVEGVSVSVFVEVDELIGVSVSVTWGLFTVDVDEGVSVTESVGFVVEEELDPPPSVDWVFNVTVTEAGAGILMAEVSGRTNSLTVKEIFALSAVVLFTEK